MTDSRRTVPKAGDIISDPVHGETVRFLQVGTDSSVTVAYVDEDRVPRRIAGTFAEFLENFFECPEGERCLC